MTECQLEWLYLVLLSAALLMSFTFNVVLCIYRRHCSACTDGGACCSRHSSSDHSHSRSEGHFVYSQNHVEELENHVEHQENPIYGNILTERVTSNVCYESMMQLRSTNCAKPKAAASDVNYASLDLKLAKQLQRKQRPLRSCAAGRDGQHEEDPPAHAMASGDASPPRSASSPKTSDSNIYLNSQQVQGGLEREEPRWSRCEGGGDRREREEYGTDGRDGRDRWDGLQRSAEEQDVHRDASDFSQCDCQV